MRTDDKTHTGKESYTKQHLRAKWQVSATPRSEPRERSLQTMPHFTIFQLVCNYDPLQVCSGIQISGPSQVLPQILGEAHSQWRIHRGESSSGLCTHALPLSLGFKDNFSKHPKPKISLPSVVFVPTIQGVPFFPSVISFQFFIF